jgi:hypothetical protein
MDTIIFDYMTKDHNALVQKYNLLVDENIRLRKVPLPQTNPHPQTKAKPSPITRLSKTATSTSKVPIRMNFL